MRERRFESDQYIDFFKEISLVHDEKASSYLNKEKDYIINTIFNFIKSKNKEYSLLDLGAGTGRIMIDLLKAIDEIGKINSIHLVESSPDMICAFKKKLNAEKINNKNIIFFQKTFQDYVKTNDQKYDIILINLLCCISGLTRDFFKEIFYMTHYSGIVVFSDIHPIRIAKRPYFEITKKGIVYKLKLRGYSEDKLIKQIVNTGFSISRILTINDSNNLPYSLILILERDNEQH